MHLQYVSLMSNIFEQGKGACNERNEILDLDLHSVLNHLAVLFVIIVDLLTCILHVTKIIWVFSICILKRIDVDLKWPGKFVEFSKFNTNIELEMHCMRDKHLCTVL